MVRFYVPVHENGLCASARLDVRGLAVAHSAARLMMIPMTTLAKINWKKQKEHEFVLELSATVKMNEWVDIGPLKRG